jgi:hypothetical protein
VILAGGFQDGVTEVATFVAGALIVAAFVWMVRFTVHVRDSVRDQNKSLADIGHAVKDGEGRAPGEEPKLYDLVLEGVERQAETAKLQKQMGETVAKHVEDDQRRFAEQDKVLDEVRGYVLDLRDKVDQLPQV